MATAIRWSDHDRYFGPITYARETQSSYRPLAFVLGSGDGDDYPGCRLRLAGFGHTLVLALPAVIKPWRRWVEITTEPTRSQIIAQGREPGYWDQKEREFGFSYSEGFLQVFRGRHTMDSATDRTWGCFLPWTQWRHVRHSLYDMVDGKPALWFDIPQGVRFDDPQYRINDAIADKCPTVAFDFADYDGERIVATTRIEEREWRFGTGRFKWLSLFRKAKIVRSLDIRFSAETGKRKGSWKGGTVGHSIDMLPGDTHWTAFRRYCDEHQMKFMGVASNGDE